MFCPTDIVTCLRSNRIEPYTTANYISNNITKRPDSVFKYCSDPKDYYLHTTYDNNNWWKTDLHRIVYINAYKLTAKNICYWVSEWNISVSLDDNWNIIDSKHNYTNNETIQFDRIFVARYINITGRAAECDSNLLAFQILYLYGALSFGILTCKQIILRWKISLISSIFIFLS